LNILKLIQAFDYPYSVPKIVTFDSTENVYSKEDIITLALLNLMGIDVIIFTPSGYDNIEHGIKEEFIDFHNLENMAFDLKYPKKINRLVKGKRRNENNGNFGWFKNFTIK